MAVEPSDFEIAPEEGTISCAAKVAGRSLVGRGGIRGRTGGLQVARSEERERGTLGGERCGHVPGRYRQARILGSSEVRRLGAHALRVRLRAPAQSYARAYLM
jgi:hypothetical protein